jgi:hypothetical protein
MMLIFDRLGLLDENGMGCSKVIRFFIKKGDGAEASASIDACGFYYFILNFSVVVL